MSDHLYASPTASASVSALDALRSPYHLGAAGEEHREDSEDEYDPRAHMDHLSDADTASARSISLSSPTHSSRHSLTADSHPQAGLGLSVFEGLSSFSTAANMNSKPNEDSIFASASTRTVRPPSPTPATHSPILPEAIEDLHTPPPSAAHTHNPESYDADDDASLYTHGTSDFSALGSSRRQSSITSAAPSAEIDFQQQQSAKANELADLALSGYSPSIHHSIVSPISPSPISPAGIGATISTLPPLMESGETTVRAPGTSTSSHFSYPPPPLDHAPSSDAESTTSRASHSSRKARPESVLIDPGSGPLVLGIALIDFNHLVGPTIEYSEGVVFEDEEVSKILPFLALPDGAHLTTEDYSYFHLVPAGLRPARTVFGISCNRQIRADELEWKGNDVTRSTVQKAVVVLASKPVFGPIRDKLGVVTRALFLQRDFRSTSILSEFAQSLEPALRSQLTESGLYMGTSIRELVHAFRSRTLVLLKALMLQKRIMFSGHPVEKLCTYQYSLISLLPGLLQTLEDCGSPPLASRAPTLTRPTSLKTSDHRSMLVFMGLPLDVFGKDSFFQPYLPLQQLDMIKETGSWLCGSTNDIVTQQKEIDVLVNIETGTLEFKDPKVERAVGLTAADRKWMDDLVKDVNDGWNEADPTRPTGMQFKGSDDYLRQKFEEYVSAALSSVKYREFVSKGEGNGVLITGGSGGHPSSADDFNPLWIAEFKRTNAYEVWDRITDPLLFDIIEPRHPCNQKPSVVADIGLRLQEGIQDLKLDQQLAPTREAINRTFNAGQTNFFKTVEGIRGRWLQRANSSSSATSQDGEPSTVSSSPVEVKAESPSSISSPTMSETNASVASGAGTRLSLKDAISNLAPRKPSDVSTSEAGAASSPLTARPLSTTAAAAATDAKAAITTWGMGVGSFFSTKASRFSLPRTLSSRSASPAPSQVSSKPASPPAHGTPPNPVAIPGDEEEVEIVIRDLDAEHEGQRRASAASTAASATTT